MASGRKNYFRHSFFARNDIKLQLLRDEIGIGFYFYYFSLLELCGETSADELKDKYVFHNSTIRSLWGVNLKKSRTISEKMNAVRLLKFEKVENTFVFVIPNFAKYLGLYTNKNNPNFASKGKERKEKERKDNNCFDFSKKEGEEIWSYMTGSTIPISENGMKYVRENGGQFRAGQNGDFLKEKRIKKELGVE